MEQSMPSERDQPPPSYTSHAHSHSHDPESISLPSVPTTELPTIHHERRLPPLPLAPIEQRFRTEPASEPFVWPSSNPLTAYYQPGPAKLSPTHKATHSIDSPGGMDLDSSTPDSHGRRGGSVVSMDDPDVRIAAEALGDLRADFITSPSSASIGLPTPSQSVYQNPNCTPPEPLLSLLTTSHPLIGNAIGGSLSAYSASKNYSPRFKSSAEYVERRITPVVNTVGTINRITGVEGGVRWFLGARRPSHHAPSESESGQESHKRRKFERRDTDDEMDMNVPRDPFQVYRQQLPHRDRRQSQVSTTDSLPAYDDHRSPSYEAAQQALVPTQTGGPGSPGTSWQSRLVLSTSGLSIAMSEESLRSLKYCLSWLKWANDHLGKIVNALKDLLDRAALDTTPALENGVSAEKSGQLIVRSDAERSALSARIAALKSDVLKTLKDVVDIVSRYAGGALPDNAKVLVRRHLTSLPQRFKLASKNSQSAANGHAHSGEQGDREITDGAHRVLVLAREGLDMMAQVSGVLDGTIVSAEEWCDKLGLKKREEAEEASNIPFAPPSWSESQMSQSESENLSNLPPPGPSPDTTSEVQVPDVKMT
ncbi:hypothetical protein PVAG01_04921 [Phlyctema vagabunda]|uniref:Uncharacterized protein n=1 Tax=Phlyctema vagabunda TaxID=108571 RepID=A0ABR4PIN5_9HELO